MNPLLSPARLGALPLRNRVVMAPLTRARAGADGAPTAETALHYADRAGAGLIVSEAADVSPRSGAFGGAPGIHRDAHVPGWRAVAEAVHARGGRLVIQLNHTGRVSAEALTGAPPLAPAVRDDDLARLHVWGRLAGGGYARLLASRPVEMGPADLDRTVAEYAAAARRAAAAGADGVELHAAHGYLLHQFLSPGVNRRSDRHGGTPGGRLHLLEQVLDAVTAAFPAGRVGVRISPYALYNHPDHADPADTYPALAALLQARGVGYLHLSDMNAVWGLPPDLGRMLALVRPAYRGATVACGALEPASGAALVERGDADAIAFGRSFVANPDLVERIARGAPLQALRTDLPHSGFYGAPGEPGYNDYPALPPDRCRGAACGQPVARRGVACP